MKRGNFCGPLKLFEIMVAKIIEKHFLTLSFFFLSFLHILITDLLKY
jgi:hypothetical protein